MDVEMKMIGRENVPQNERQSVVIETHGRRGDDYVVMRSDTVLENDTVRMRVPSGGRLMVSVPDNEEIVYDAAQGAAVRRSNQENMEGRADSPVTGEQRRAVPQAGPVDAQGRPDTSFQARTPTGTRPLTQPQPQPGAPQMRPPQTQPTQNASPKPSSDPKSQATEAAKTQQQSGAGRPSGENPPKPGSPVGSPPDGNEGKDK